MRNSEDGPTTTIEKVNLFESTNLLLTAIYSEIQALAKKKPDATLNTAKVKVINRLLEDIRKCLQHESSMKYLDLLQDEDLPQYSDVTIILSQYSAALAQFKSRYYYRLDHEHKFSWHTE